MVTIFLMQQEAAAMMDELVTPIATKWQQIGNSKLARKGDLVQHLPHIFESKWGYTGSIELLLVF